MAFDGHKNFAYSTILTAPSPATSGTSLVVQSADGAKFPAVSFNATIWPAGSQPTTANSEIVRVTAISTDTFTITRTQESTSARTVIVGDQIAATITVKAVTDLEALFPGGPIAALTSWTPTWTNVTIGNATVTAKYLQIGKIVYYRIHVVWGSTTSMSGTPAFSLPTTSISYPGTATAQPIGTCALFQTNVYKGDIVWASTTTASLRFYQVNAANIINATPSSTVPATWTTGSEWHGEGFYETS